MAWVFDVCIQAEYHAELSGHEVLIVGLATVGRRAYENTIQRPPMPTPDHSTTETTATTLLQIRLIRASSPMVTLRCTVNVKRMARNKDAIFIQNAAW